MEESKKIHAVKSKTKSDPSKNVVQLDRKKELSKEAVALANFIHATVLESRQCIILDFSGRHEKHKDVYDKIVARSKRYMRTPDMQVIYDMQELVADHPIEKEPA